MKNNNENSFVKSPNEFDGNIQYLLTDIDDTLTDEGRLGPEAYESLWQLHKSGISVIPVTGRPAGWCEMIARVWPVAGVIGENGGFYFRYHNKKMIRHFVMPEKTRIENQKKLEIIKSEILKNVKGSAIASDQFSRLLDLAIDFCEDVPRLPKSEIEKIVKIFIKHGAQAKVSSIHVNGWFGTYNKLSESLFFLKNEFNISDVDAKKYCAFVGDSPNDEPMWSYFPNSFAVANVVGFFEDLASKPKYVAKNKGGIGFSEITRALLKNQ